MSCFQFVPCLFPGIAGLAMRCRCFRYSDDICSGCNRFTTDIEEKLKDTFAYKRKYYCQVEDDVYLDLENHEKISIAIFSIPERIHEKDE